MKKFLIAGWFSFENMGASAGDLITRDLVCEWLRDAGCQFDVALAPPFCGGVEWTKLNPLDYSHVIFVCGPFGKGWPVTEFLRHFSSCRMIGLNLSMLDPLDQWNPFDRLWERDSSVTARPDLAFLSAPSQVPIAGLVLIDTQPEYGEKNSHEHANQALRKLAANCGAAVVNIDTRLDANTTGFSTSAQVESLIGRMDVVLTTRLHGTVLAIKNGVPALAVDSVVGGGKIAKQAEAIGWPCVLSVESITEEMLQRAFAYCLTGEARERAKYCASRACEQARQVRTAVIKALGPFGDCAKSGFPM